jgi:hypothetical protein
MKKISPVLILLIFLSGAAHAEDKFRVDATFYNNSSAEINNLQIVEDADRTTALNRGEFSLIKTDRDGRRLTVGKLPVDFTGYVRTQEGGLTYEKNSINKIIYLNYSKDIIKLHLNTNGEDKASYNIIRNKCKSSDGLCRSYCKGKKVDVDCTCGDDICQEDLNEDELCPQDCETPSQPNQQNQEGDNEANQDDQSDTVNTSQEQPVEVVDSGTNTGILVLIGILFILVALVLASGKVSIEA